jgi:hypothetical protein
MAAFAQAGSGLAQLRLRSAPCTQHHTRNHSTFNEGPEMTARSSKSVITIPSQPLVKTHP